jgi:hypothetical protein
MAAPLRATPPDPRQANDFGACFAVVDCFRRQGLYSELVEHVLFAPLGCCFCSRCQFASQPDRP